MSNYKERISGTISNVVGKVKDAAGSGSVRDFYDKGTGRAKAYAQIAKLTLELNGANDELKKVYCEIGKLYFEQAKDCPEGYFAPLFAQAENVCASIAAKKEEIASLKELVSANNGDIEVEITEDIDADLFDFESIVSADEDRNR